MGREAAEQPPRRASSKDGVDKVPVVAMKAVKAIMKAAPSRGAILMKAKAALKAKAGVMKTAMKAGTRTTVKAIAAKEFAGVAAKLKKTKSTEALPGTGTWYFMSDLRKMKVGADDSKAWTKYDAKMNKQLEVAYTKGFKQYTMKFKDKEYIVKFKAMMQFRADDKSLQRPVKRE
eukprot:TRINITY_DN19305_c0_g1_i1.p2 TRINITY_DN19305_c0_g1~~TRINITY_DN19305_c0_g1_i1.p2  ORF type:complete len:175 (-),score=49.30 TRINITY_DN19305_c0_g1_i1:300-824(-)